MTEVAVACCMYLDDEEMCVFTISLSDQETIESLSEKAVARYSQRTKRRVNVKPNSPYLFIDFGRYPQQGYIVSENMQTVGDLLEFMEQFGRKTLSVRFDLVVQENIN